MFDTYDKSGDHNLSTYLINCDFKGLACREKAPVCFSLCLYKVGEVSLRPQKIKTQHRHLLAA